MFWFFGHQACGALAPLPGIQPTPLALEGEVLTTGPSGKPPTLGDFQWPIHILEVTLISVVRKVAPFPISLFLQ